jgi:hypothetical protein
LDSVPQLREKTAPETASRMKEEKAGTRQGLIEDGEWKIEED